MRQHLAFSVTLLAALAATTPAAPCTVVMAHDAERTLVGNNEDATDTATLMTVVPGGEGEYGRVTFGLSTGYTQGGMNDQGLFIDGLHVHAEGWRHDPQKVDFAGDNIIDAVLATCADVEEAAALFASHNVPSLAHASFPIADAGGGAILVEWGDGRLQIRRRDGRFQVATNFVQSEQEADDRYRIAHEVLAARPDVSLETVRAVLSATHQERKYPTLYSNLYDLRRGTVLLYTFHDFAQAVEIDVAAEVARGPRTVAIPSLYPTVPYASLEFERDRPQRGSSVLLEIIDEHGVEAALARYHELKKVFHPVYDTDVGEGELNRLGYLLLRQGRAEEAVAILVLNASEHPESANAHDSLGEAYAALGRRDEALRSYRRSLQLDPGNGNAQQWIDKLSAQE